ncbi:MAG: hypothetical protein RR731_06485, partial [Oscillospiraceae bacterium]
YESIVKGLNIPQPGVPESFKVLVKELQSLCLDVRVLDKDGDEIELKDDEEDDFSPEFKEDLYLSADTEIEASGFTIESADGEAIEIAEEVEENLDEEERV